MMSFQMGMKGSLLAISFVYFLTVQGTNPLSERRCNEACSRSIVDEEAKTCALCVNSIPINFPYCENACVKGLEPICDKCRDHFLQLISGETCIYACQQIYESSKSVLMTKICGRCMRSPPKSAFLCDHACKAKNNMVFTRMCYSCLLNKS